MKKICFAVLAVIFSVSGFLRAGEAGELVRLERPIGVSDLGGCAFYRGILSLPHSYTQGADGSVVLEAEDATTTNIGAEGPIGPFSSTEQNLIAKDYLASLGRYVAFAKSAKWERAQWTFTVTKPIKVTAWYRIYATDVGEYAHTETLNDKGGERIVLFKTADKNDKFLRDWQWVKGRDYELAAGTNKFTIDWHNSARLDQIAFLPAGVQLPWGDTPLPTFDKTLAAATAVTMPIKLADDEQAERLVAQVDAAGGQVVWEMSRDNGKTWMVPISPNKDLPGKNSQEPETIIFRVKLTESAQHASPLIQAVRLVVSKPRPVRELSAIPPAMQYQDSAVALIPALWSGLRFRNGAWTLMEAIQPDTQGVLWMDAASADFIDLLPSSRSWVGEVAGSFSGKAIRQGLWNRNVIAFDINVPKKDTYRPWFRVQLTREKFDPNSFHPTVTYQFGRQPLTMVEIKDLGALYPLSAFRKREWVWLPGKEIETESGVQTFRVRSGLTYTWLDRVCLVPSGAPSPQGPGGVSTRAMVSNASVTFQPLTGIMAKSWKDVQAQSSAKGGRLVYSFSRDNGKTWTDLKDNNLDVLGGTTAASPDVTLRCTLAPDAEGKAPRIAAWKATAKEAGEPLLQLANREQKILFDPATGDLLGWWSTQDGWVVPPGRRQPLFELGLPDGVARPVAGSLQRRETTIKDGVSTLLLDYLLAGGSIVAKVSVELPETGLARWKLRVENSSTYQVYGLTFPIIGGVRVGDDAEANRAPIIDGMATEGSGTLFVVIAKLNPSSGVYPGWTSMGWYSLYGVESSGSFTLQTRNKDAYHIWMTQDNDPAALAMCYKFSRMLVVDPESSGEAAYDIGWHAGDWHRSADFYRRWARTWMTPLERPEWVKNADGWMDGGALLASRYITHAWPNMEWFGANYSQNFARQIEAIPSSSPFPYINPRLGTPEEFRQAHAEARKRGWYNTYYLNQAWSDNFADKEFLGPTPRRLLPPEVRLRPRGFTEQWAQTAANGSFGHYSEMDNLDGPCYYMCGTGWLDMMDDAIVWNYGKVLGADGVYLDQSACTVGFCFNTNHGHGTQRAAVGGYTIEAMRRTIAAGRKNNPNFTMAAEGNNDQCMQYADFGLWYGYLFPFLEGDVFKYTFPEVQLIKGHLNGGQMAGLDFGDYARHSLLYLCNDLMGNQHDKKEFYAHRKRIGDWMHGGEFQDNVGLTISKPGIEAKWFKRSDGEHVGAAVNIENEDHIEGAVLRLKWDELRFVNKAFAYLWGGEVKSLPVRWENGSAAVEVPAAQASTILLIAKEPQNEVVRGHCYWPLNPGPDKLILVLVNTSDKNQTVKLAWNPPAGVTLKAPPAQCDLPAGEVARMEVIMDGIGAMQQRGRVEVQGNGPSKFTASCVVAPPLVNGGFEVDSMGNGTPDMWQADSNEIFIQILQLKELPPIVCNEKEIIHHADGFIDKENAAEGKNALLLPGRLMLPYTWARNPEDKSPVPIQPFYFKSGQPVILKSGTKYVLRCKYKQETDDGLLEMSAELYSWCPELPAFAPQRIPAVKGERGWVQYSFEFTTPAQLAGIIDLQFVNKGAGKAWLDAVEIKELGPGKND